MMPSSRLSASTTGTAIRLWPMIVCAASSLSVNGDTTMRSSPISSRTRCSGLASTRARKAITPSRWESASVT
ncbi:Uncharacterised protein [Mycobacterium tuberculosis]|nr:Uncharacterised protein [Mycobacterium tuberculosis]